MFLTHFGFQKIDAALKSGRVQKLFSDVAKNYDRMNDVMSFGLHRLWKDTYVQNLPIKRHHHILDVAGGTGDIAERIHKKYPHCAPTVTICDLTPGMMESGRDRLVDAGSIFDGGLHWVCGNGEHLPFSNNTFDGATISFGLRNVTHIDQALSDINRVLKPKGWFSCLEFSHVEWEVFQKIYDTYSFQLIPFFGEKIAGDRDAYQYLVESIRQFPNQENLKDKMKKAGFKHVTHQNMMNGLVAIHTGFAA